MNIKNWWRFKTQKEAKLAWQDALSVVNYLKEHQSYRQKSNLRNLKLYGNVDTLGLSVGTYARETVSDTDRKLKLNVVQSIIDTIISKITLDQPRVMFLTDGGNFTQKQRAKKLNKFIDGQFYASGSYENGEMAAIDSCVAGTGFTKVFIHGGKVCEERVFFNEVLVDDSEAFYGKPQQMWQSKVISKDVLKEIFPDFKANIDAAKNADNATMSSNFTTEQTMVVEGWHLPSGEDSEDGRHIIFIDGATLVYEDYDLDVFPIVPLKWTERLTGFYGQGVAEQLAPIQLEINKTLKTIQMSLHLCGVPHWLKEKGSKIVNAFLDNKIGGIITWSGVKPELMAPNPVPVQLIDHLNRLVQYAYEQVGVSMLSAQGKKPAGVDAGVALRELIDIESSRFSTFQKRYERYYIDKAKLHIELTKKLVEENEDYKVFYRGKDGLEEIAWSEVNIDKDKYIMQPFPTSFLPKTPAGRLQTVQELVQAGFISKEDGFKLLDFPDVQGTTNLIVSASNEIDMVIERIIENKEYTAPEPFQNLEYGIQKMQGAYLQAKMTGVPEDRLELLRRWMKEAMLLLSPSPAMTPAPEVPPANPEQAPVSDLIPNTNQPIQ